MGLEDIVVLAVNESELGHALEVVTATLAQRSFCLIVKIADLFEESDLELLEIG